MENQRKDRDHNIVKIRQNTKKSPGHLRRLAVTQTSGKENHLKLT